MSRSTPRAPGPSRADPAPHRSTPDYAAELRAAVEAAREAGAAIREVYSGTQDELRFKTAGDPLTIADEAADRIIHERLTATFPDDAWLSEEGSPGLTGGDRMWVVDPLDGTREFVDRIPEFAVSIALLEGGQPMVAVVYQPIRDVLVSAIRDGGAAVDGRPAHVSEHDDLASASMLASRSEVRRGEWTELADDCRVTPTGSIAWKLALVAIGAADATISLAPKHGWDVAAGVLLVEEAGGRAARLDGSALSLARPGELLDGLIGTNAALFDAVVERVTRLPATIAEAPATEAQPVS